MNNITIDSNVSLTISTINISSFIIGTFSIIFLVITIILLSDTDTKIKVSHLLDTIHDFKHRQKRFPNSINLLFTELPRNPAIYGGRSSVFLFDNNDPSGRELQALFAGKNYTLHNALGHQGYVLLNSGSRMRAWWGEGERLNAPVLVRSVAEVTARGMTVRSGISPAPLMPSGSNTVSYLVQKVY